MREVVAVCGALGAWLLVAGPIYQAALELGEQEFDREQLSAAFASVPPSPRVSLWWWLLPPVAYVLQARRSRAHRQAIMDVLTPEQLRQMVTFMNKANGWFVVASGAFLLAVQQTWALQDLFGWPPLAFWVMVVALSLLCVGYVIYRMLLTDRVLRRDQQTTAVGRSRKARSQGA